MKLEQRPHHIDTAVDIWFTAKGLHYPQAIMLFQFLATSDNRYLEKLPNVTKLTETTSKTIR